MAIRKIHHVCCRTARPQDATWRVGVERVVEPTLLSVDSRSEEPLPLIVPRPALDGAVREYAPDWPPGRVIPHVPDISWNADYSPGGIVLIRYLLLVWIRHRGRSAESVEREI